MPELPPEAIILSRNLDLVERKNLYRQCGSGKVVQLHRGAYVDADLWLTLSADAQHRARALAVAVHFDDDFVFSHCTAAALWRLPVMGSWPTLPHIAGPRGAAGRTASFVRHGLGLPVSAERIDGLAVTTLAATVVDVGATVGFAHAVVVADAALRRTFNPVEGLARSPLTRDHLIDELVRVKRTHGARKAELAIDFADARADRPGESMSRVSIHLARLSPPELQVPLRGASGKEYIVDFYWKQFSVIGEFDGKFKYTDPAYMNGRTAQQVLYDEKLREDDLRAASHGFTRWPWATAISPTLLGAQLRRAGVR